MPGACKRLDHRHRLVVADNDLRVSLGSLRIQGSLQTKEASTHDQKWNDRFLNQRAQSIRPGHQEGLYQIGLV